MHFLKFNGKIDRRSPKDEGKPEDPILRQNWLSRDGVLKKPAGTERVITNLMSDRPRWIDRYYSIETGIISPKTFVYTKDGKLWHKDDLGRLVSVVQVGLNQNAYPKSWPFKQQTQTLLFLVDGKDLWKYDGNNDYKWEKVTLVDVDKNPFYPTDIIEHRDRLILMTEAFVYISKNLEPTVFDDSTDSIQIIIGSGKGKNLALGKIEDRLYILNTEGIFALSGDVISALASTFEVRLVEERKIIAGRTAKTVEKAINFLADDLELWSFNGQTSEMLSYNEKLKDFINPYRDYLDKAVADYYNHYYMLSVVGNNATENDLEIWWDALENKIEFIKGRNVAAYMHSDPTRELPYQELCRSDVNTVMLADITTGFDDTPIESLLKTRDIVVEKGRNVRFTNFYPHIQPIGDRYITFTYFLDGRLSNLTGTPNWQQHLMGESKVLGGIHINNQNQAMYAVSPKIWYAKGQSIAFDISDATPNLQCEFLGIGIEYVRKHMKKKRFVGA